MCPGLIFRLLKLNPLGCHFLWMGKRLMICIWFVYGFEYGKMVYESRMLSKGSRFTLGVWGLRVCSLDVVFTAATVRNRSQPFAAVRSRPQPFAWRPYGRAYGEFCNSGHFWTFQSSRTLVSRAGVALYDFPTCFITCQKYSKIVLFSEDAFQFSFQAQHFGNLHRHFAWQAPHFRRVMLRVFCESHCQGCVKWRQAANCVAGVASCETCWKLTEASQETSIFR